MHINRQLLESGAELTKHFMTEEEEQLKIDLCRLLISKKHGKFARRFLEFDFNLVDHNDFPDFTAAVSFDEATIYISTGFLGSGQAIFNQLDVLLRHELAHSLMMHQIRMMYILKQRNVDDPDEAYNRISYSIRLHDLMNIITDLEISNERYTAEDKLIVYYMTLNGTQIGGLITDLERPDWASLRLEDMYDELVKEITSINRDIRTNPNWTPELKSNPDQDFIKMLKIDPNKKHVDSIKYSTAKAIAAYSNAGAPSKINCPLKDFIKSKEFSKFADIFKNIITDICTSFDGFGTTDDEKDEILELVNDIADSLPLDVYKLINPFTGSAVCKLYTPEEKSAATEALKNLGGLINNAKYKAKVKITKATHSKEYTDAWNEVVTKLSSDKFDDSVLSALLDHITNT